MKYTWTIISYLFFAFCLFCSNVQAEEDIFAAYKKDMRKDAEAHATSVYGAYSENMANLIEHGVRDGIVINGAGNYGKGVKADGLGNVTIDRNAKIGTLINKTKIENTTVILKNMGRY